MRFVASGKPVKERNRTTGWGERPTCSRTLLFGSSHPHEWSYLWPSTVGVVLHGPTETVYLLVVSGKSGNWTQYLVLFLLTFCLINGSSVDSQDTVDWLPVSPAADSLDPLCLGCTCLAWTVSFIPTS